MEAPEGEVTRLLAAMREGRSDANDRLIQLVYGELRQIAAAYMRRERPDHTLQPTALVNEAYLRLIAQHHQSFQNRSHFLALAAQVMRRILVDHARSRLAEKRGGGNRVEMEDSLAITEQRSADVLSVHEALDALAKIDARQASIVEMRYFGGLSIEEVAEALQIAPRTASRDWRMAKAWLRRAIEEQPPA